MDNCRRGCRCQILGLEPGSPQQAERQTRIRAEQIEGYLDRSRLEWGILTNGKRWRLIPRSLTPQQHRLSEQSVHLEDFLRFYLFFSPAGFRDSVQRKSLVQRASEGSSEYRLGVSEGLKGPTFEALRTCIEGFLAYAPNQLTPDADLLRSREQSFILLCRLLFITYAEDRRLLPYKLNRLYTENRSLGRLRDDVARRLDRSGRLDEGFDRASTALWQDLESLFDLIDRGHARYGVPAYNGGLFDADAHPFLNEKKLSDWHLARVIDRLGRAKDPETPTAGLFRVDYRDLAIQHLGGIYEGLLELHPLLASERIVVWTRRSSTRRSVTRVDPWPPPVDSRREVQETGGLRVQRGRGRRCGQQPWGKGPSAFAVLGEAKVQVAAAEVGGAFRAAGVGALLEAGGRGGHRRTAGETFPLQGHPVLSATCSQYSLEDPKFIN